MKVLLALHGYPPELTGGTELAVQGLVRGLLARGHGVVVVAGSLRRADAGELALEESEDRDPASGRAARVVRLRRPDLHFEHWQKSLHPGVGAAFEALLEAERPDVVHVHHWIRLTRDLVARAARRGVPAVVTLHDLWTTCLVTFRVHTGTRAFCEAPLGPSPCLACAGALPPATPWMDAVALRMALAGRIQDVARELDLARAVLAPSAAQVQAVARWLGRPEGWGAVRIAPPGRALDLPRVGPRARAAGEPLVLASFGHRTALKGFDLLLEAVRLLPDSHAVRVVLAGGAVDPEYEAHLASLAEGLDVELHDSYDAAALGDHPAARAHAFVSGSRAHESWGLSLDEALALGLPAVLPRAGAFAERAEGAAWAELYTQNDASDLARVIRELLEDPARLAAMGAALPSPADALPSEEANLDVNLSAYEDAVAAGPPEVAAADWWADRMATAELVRWDEALTRGEGARQPGGEGSS